MFSRLLSRWPALHQVLAVLTLLVLAGQVNASTTFPGSATTVEGLNVSIQRIPEPSALLLLLMAVLAAGWALARRPAGTPSVPGQRQTLPALWVRQRWGQHFAPAVVAGVLGLSAGPGFASSLRILFDASAANGAVEANCQISPIGWTTESCREPWEIGAGQQAAGHTLFTVKYNYGGDLDAPTSPPHVNPGLNAFWNDIIVFVIDPANDGNVVARLSIDRVADAPYEWLFDLAIRADDMGVAGAGDIQVPWNRSGDTVLLETLPWPEDFRSFAQVALNLVPEPGSLLLASMGLSLILASRRKIATR